MTELKKDTKFDLDDWLNSLPKPTGGLTAEKPKTEDSVQMVEHSQVVVSWEKRLAFVIQYAVAWILIGGSAVYVISILPVLSLFYFTIFTGLELRLDVAILSGVIAAFSTVIYSFLIDRVLNILYPQSNK